MSRSIGRWVTAPLVCALLWSLFVTPAEAAQKATRGSVQTKSCAMDLKLDTKRNRLTEKVTIRVKNATNHRVKRLYFRNMAHSVLAYDRENYPERENAKLKSEILSVQVKGKKRKVRYQKDRSVFCVDLGSQSLGRGKTLKVTIRARTDVPLRDDHHSGEKYTGFCHCLL